MSEGVRLAFEGHTARITLARPEKLNPLDWETVRALRSAVNEIEARAQVSVVIVTGQGRSFSAGGDLEGYLSLYRRPDDFSAYLHDFHAMLAAIEAAGAIYIAAVNGLCVAGGLELLLACDLALAADAARIGDGHLNFGQLPGAGGSQRLPRAIGLLRAKHLMLTGELLDAVAAERLGLLNGVVPAAELGASVSALAARLAEKSRAGLRGMKHLANLTLTTDLREGLEREIAYVHRHATNEPDAMEGLQAFQDKRPPRFSGR